MTGMTIARALSWHGVPVIGVDQGRPRFASYSSSFVQVNVGPHFGAPFIERLEAGEEVGREIGGFVKAEAAGLCFGASHDSMGCWKKFNNIRRDIFELHQSFITARQ